MILFYHAVQTIQDLSGRPSRGQLISRFSRFLRFAQGFLKVSSFKPIFPMPSRYIKSFAKIGVWRCFAPPNPNFCILLPSPDRGGVGGRAFRIFLLCENHIMQPALGVINGRFAVFLLSSRSSPDGYDFSKVHPFPGFPMLGCHISRFAKTRMPGRFAPRHPCFCHFSPFSSQELGREGGQGVERGHDQ